jgi:hypothetical protein
MPGLVPGIHVFPAAGYQDVDGRDKPGQDAEMFCSGYSIECASAIFRKQSRHRQSLASTGIGNRAVSSSHQHGPDRLQVNSVPQPEQARRRDGGGLSNRFVMQQSIRPKKSNRQFNYEGRDLVLTTDLRAVMKA